MDWIATLFYPVFLLIVFLFTLLFIPREDYKEYLIYGVLVGALGDMVTVGLYQNVFHIIVFKNAGIFNALGLNFLSPLCWIAVVMLYLRFLPNRRWFRYFYVVTFAAFSVGYGLLVRNAGLFDFREWVYPGFAFFTFLAWWLFATWLFLKTSPLAKAENRRR